MLKTCDFTVSDMPSLCSKGGDEHGWTHNHAAQSFLQDILLDKILFGYTWSFISGSFALVLVH